MFATAFAINAIRISIARNLQRFILGVAGKLRSCRNATFLLAVRVTAVRGIHCSLCDSLGHIAILVGDIWTGAVTARTVILGTAAIVGGQERDEGRGELHDGLLSMTTMAMLGRCALEVSGQPSLIAGHRLTNQIDELSTSQKLFIRISSTINVGVRQAKFLPNVLKV